MSATTALVGFTGLVGGNLREQRSFDMLARSTNAVVLRGERFEHVVFSAARAEKWRANADPAADERHIDDLIDLASSFTSERVTLISTVDVFAQPVEVDESAPVDLSGLHAYGAGRRRLEEAVVAAHPDVLVVRLPALFGSGLKKNVVYDLLHDNGVDRIQPASSFQYYALDRLGDDIDTAWAAGIHLCHLVTQPIRTERLVEEVFRRAPLPPSAAPVVGYDVRSAHAALFGVRGDYLETADQVIARMGEFVARTAQP